MADESKRYVTTRAITNSYHGSIAFNIIVSGETPSELIGAQIILDLNNSHEVFTWNGTAIVVNIPYGSSFTVTGEDFGSYTAPDPITVGTSGYESNDVVITYESFAGFDLSMMNITGGTLTARETANCYVIRSAVTYMLPLIYGAAIKNGSENSNAYKRPSTAKENTHEYFNYKNNKITSPYIETDTNTTAVSAQVLYTDITGYTITNLQFKTRGGIKFLCFDVTALPSLGGNAVVAIKDGSGTIMWSWHLWAYPSSLSTFTMNSRSVLAVDLGWVKKSNNSQSGSSPYYQWGRKDPFPRYGGTASYTTGSCASSVAQAIQNPTKFFLMLDVSTSYPSTSGMGWWKSGSTCPYCVNYWDSSSTGRPYNTISTITPSKTVYDPCPIGFVIPCGAIFDENYINPSTSSPTINGNYFSPNGEIDMRSGITYYDEGYGGWYCADFSPEESYYNGGVPYADYYYYSSSWRFYFTTGYYAGHAIGRSIRPMKV